MMIFEITFQNAAQMIFTKHDQVIQTLATNRTDDSFHEWILPRTSGGCNDLLDLHASYPPAKLFAVDLVAIPQEEARCRLFRKCFDDLLRGPGGGRMLGDIEVRHTSAMMSKYDQDKQHTECGRGNDEKSIDTSSLRWLSRKVRQV